jgi:hypothetical protein
MRSLDDTTVGLEVEFQGLSSAALKSINYIPYSIHDDGSTRGEVYVLEDGGLPIILQNPSGRSMVVPSGVRRVKDIGLEMVTEPIRYKDIREPLARLSADLRCIPQTPRTSVHVHVDISNIPWILCRNVLLWAYALEAPLFRLSCGGGFHRGERLYRKERTDYRFCRPLSMPIAALWGIKEGPLILWDDLVQAKTASEFVAAWGRADVYWSNSASLPHYIGHRLHMINLVAALRIGTLEWRLFDGVYGHLDSFVDIVMAIHRLAYEGPPDFEPMTLGSEPSVDQYDLTRMLNVDVSMLWGKRWPSGCKTEHLHPHYGKLALTHASKNSLRLINWDNGGQNVPLVRR